MTAKAIAKWAWRLGLAAGVAAALVAPRTADAWWFLTRYFIR